MDKRNRPHLTNSCWRKSGCRFSSKVQLFFAASIILIVGACSIMRQSELPPIPSDPMASKIDGQFVWMDLMTEDIAAATSFYSQLFGWWATKSKQNSDYYLIYFHGKPIAGMVETDNQDQSKPESLWIPSMSVSDVNQSLAIVNSHGGKVLEGPLEVKGRGSMALISDPAGAPFILLDTLGDGPEKRSTESGNWIWTDLFTRNREQAIAFYGNFVGFRAEHIVVEKTHTYELLKKNGRTIAGIVTLQWEGMEDNWLPYFKVDDIDETIERARMLGGHLILQNDDVAILIDSTGAAFGIQR